MHSKKPYKICICLVVLRELESFQNYQGWIIFQKILDANWRFMKVRIFLILLSITFWKHKILGFPFCMKNSLTWGEKCEKLDFRKSQKINYIRFKNCTWMECSSRNSKQFSSNKKFYAIFASLNKYYTENNRWVPLLIWD